MSDIPQVFQVLGEGVFADTREGGVFESLGEGAWNAASDGLITTIPLGSTETPLTSMLFTPVMSAEIKLGGVVVGELRSDPALGLYTRRPAPKPTWGAYVPTAIQNQIQGLMILNSHHHGCRDIYWTDIPDARVWGYNIYKSEDHQNTWERLNDVPLPGNRYRDETRLDIVTYHFDLERDWVEQGRHGSWRLRVPGETFWSDVVAGRVIVADAVRDVTLTINGHQILPARVVGLEGEVWLPVEALIPFGGGHTPLPSWSPKHLGDVTIRYKKLKNNVNIHLNGQTYYTVVPVDTLGNEFHAPGVLGTEVRNTMDVDAMDYMQAEMVRRNAWLFEMASEPAHLLIRRTKGKSCGCVNPETLEPRTGCKMCHEVGILGGYYGALDIFFNDPDTAITRTMEEGGAKVERESRSYLGPSPIVKNGDLIVRKNGERMVVGNVTYKSPRGVLLQQEFDVHLLPPGSTKYLIPIAPCNSELYHPSFTRSVDELGRPINPIPGEPLTSPTGDPTKKWENTSRMPEGRTRVFGNIQT